MWILPLQSGRSCAPSSFNPTPCRQSFPFVDVHITSSFQTNVLGSDAFPAIKPLRRETGLTQRVDFSAPSSVCYVKMETSRSMPCPTTRQANLPACSPFVLSAKYASGGKHFLKSFGTNRQEKWTPSPPTAKRTLKPLRIFFDKKAKNFLYRRRLITTELKFGNSLLSLAYVTAVTYARHCMQSCKILFKSDSTKPNF